MATRIVWDSTGSRIVWDSTGSRIVWKNQSTHGEFISGESFNITTANSSTGVRGIDTDGSRLFIVQNGYGNYDSELYGYSFSGSRQSSYDITLASIDDPVGLQYWSSSLIRIPDNSSDFMFCYQSNGNRRSAMEFSLTSANSGPRGTVAQGYSNTSQNSYVGDTTDSKIYAYDYSGVRKSSQEFNTSSSPRSLTYDYTNHHIYVLTSSMVQVYNTSGTRQSSKEFNLNSANSSPFGLTMTSTRFYIGDINDNKVYVYRRLA